MGLQESGEMYLESILVLTEKNKSVRSIDVGEYLGVSKPSVSRAIGILRDGGYVTSGKDGALVLTEKGRNVAEKIYERHIWLTKVLVRLGVDERIAVADACKMEHDISDESFEALKQYIQSQENK